MARWKLNLKPKRRPRDPRPSSPYDTAVERFARRHPMIALAAAEVAFALGAVAALVALVERWSLPQAPFVALLIGASAAAISAAALVRLRRDGVTAAVPILLLSWLPPVLAAVAALNPQSAGGWAVVAGYGFMAVYLAACGVLAGLGPRIGRHEEALRRSVFRERRRAALRTARRLGARRPGRRPQAGDAPPSS